MWDAETYDKVADPQEAWAREILAHADLRPGERVLDAGCGSGRVTKLLLKQGVTVTAVDADAAMVAKAREQLPAGVPVLHRDLLNLKGSDPFRFDVVFSCAVFHWITDHERLFANLHAALRPGGRLVAQCGGHGNLAKVLEHAPDRAGDWLYATPEDTERRLRQAGFTEARAWLEPKPTHVDDLVQFLTTVVFRTSPDPRAVAERVAPRIDHLDYVRLNIDARA